jgi:predicted heme/steroid binding protein
MRPYELHPIQRVVFFLFFISLFLVPSQTEGSEEFARQTGKDCTACHRSSEGGPNLTPYGEAYQRGGFQYPIPKEAFRILPWYERIVRFVVGYLHLAAGLVWLGTIFYVHVIIKPQTLTQGLPRSELILGWVCIVVTGTTGTLLTISKITKFSQLYTTRFGIILSAKAILFLMMVGIAVMTTFVIQRKLQQKSELQKTDQDHPGGRFTHTDLLSFDGSSSRPAYVAVDGEVYDVSESPSWKDGRHMAQHFAGRDLSSSLLSAPHGREVLSKFEKMGGLWEGQTEAQPQITSVRKAFFLLAKSALVILFLILFCIAMWRWG